MGISCRLYICIHCNINKFITSDIWNRVILSLIFTSVHFFCLLYNGLRFFVPSQIFLHKEQGIIKTVKESFALTKGNVGNVLLSLILLTSSSELLYFIYLPLLADLMKVFPVLYAIGIASKHKLLTLVLIPTTKFLSPFQGLFHGWSLHRASRLREIECDRRDLNPGHHRGRVVS